MNEIIRYLIISFISAVTLIFISKVILERLIRRDKDYYERYESEEEEAMLKNINIVERK